MLSVSENKYTLTSLFLVLKIVWVENISCMCGEIMDSLFIYLFIYLFIHLFINSFIYLFIFIFVL